MRSGDDASAELRQREPVAWPAYLNERSGLPGPRANLTLVAIAAQLAGPDEIDELLRDGGEYTAVCAAAALARHADDPASAERSRALAADERWRVREGVAIGLQVLGDALPSHLSEIVLDWADDPDPLVQRAAAAAICEPRLLRAPDAAATAVEVCRRGTARIAAEPAARRKDPGVRTLRQALGYCWSVAIAADPAPGLAAFRALDTTDADIAWIVSENRKKKRLSALL